MNYLRQGAGFYRDVLRLMLPMILQNFVTNFMALADNFMVGGLSQTALSAVTMANTPFFVLMVACFGIQSGASVLVAQYYGKGDLRTVSRVLGVGLYISMGVTAVAALLAARFPLEMMRLLTNNSALWEMGADYARIVGFSYFFGSISGIYLAVQRSVENPKVGAVILTASGLLNIFLNWLFIFGSLGAPRMGVAGAALGTLLSRIFEVLAVLVHIRLDKRLPLFPRLIFRPGGVIFRDYVRFALPVLFNELLWSTGISLYSVIFGHMPDNTALLAAYTVASNLERVLNVALIAAGNAAAVIIGRELGRGNQESVYGKAVALNTVSLGVGAASVLLLLFTRFFLAEQLIFPLMRLEPEAVGIALYMLTVLACVSPLRALNLCNITGILRGGGDVRYATIMDVSFIYLACAPLAALAGLVLKLDIRYVYPLLCLDEVIKVWFCLARVRSRKWIRNITRDMA